MCVGFPIGRKAQARYDTADKLMDIAEIKSKVGLQDPLTKFAGQEIHYRKGLIGEKNFTIKKTDTILSIAEKINDDYREIEKIEGLGATELKISEIIISLLESNPFLKKNYKKPANVTPEKVEIPAATLESSREKCEVSEGTADPCTNLDL